MPDDGCADESHETGQSYSPPCYLRDVDPAYAGYLTKPEILELLNELIEGERAGARAATQCLTEAEDRDTRSALRRIAIDEARFCAMLSRHVREVGGMPSPATGSLLQQADGDSGPAQAARLSEPGPGMGRPEAARCAAARARRPPL